MWSYQTLGAVQTSPAVSGGLVYVGSCDGGVYALNASTGSLVWKYQTWSSERHWPGVISSPAVSGGLVYVGSCDDNVYALNASTGSLVWKYTTGFWVESSPAVSGGVVYVGSDDGDVYALNATTGALLWSHATGRGVSSSPAVSGGLVYASSGDGNLYALNATTGVQIWACASGGSSPAVANGVVYVGSGTVYALGSPSSVPNFPLWASLLVLFIVLVCVALFVRRIRRPKKSLTPAGSAKLPALRFSKISKIMCAFVPSSARSRDQNNKT
jgi:outer membrane protein assembly factor BamB